MADQAGIILSAELRFDESKLQQSLARIEKNFKFNSPFGSANNDVSAFDKSLDRANQRVISFGASLTVLSSGVKVFKDIVKATTEVEAAFIDINSIFNLSKESLDKFSKSLFDVARNTSQSFATAADAAKEFSRQGLSAEETLKRTRDALILTRLSNLDAAASVNVLTAAVNGFQKSGLNTTDILNKFVAVDQNFAVSVSDLAEGFARAGASASDAGVSVNDLIALITAAQQTTARGGAVIGNALKTIFTRVQRGSILDDFAALGVKIKDSQGYLLPTIDILKNFASTYDKLSGSIKKQAAELVGGVYQINILKATIQDLSKINGVFAQSTLIASNASDQALKRNALLNESYEALGEQVATTNKQIYANIGNQLGTFIKPVIKFGLDNPVVDALKDASGQAATYGGIFAQSLLKGIGSSLLIGLGPILLAAGGKIALRTVNSVFSATLQEAGLQKSQAQTAEVEKTVTQYARGNAALKQQVALYADLNAAASKFNANIASGKNGGFGNVSNGKLSAPINPLLTQLLGGGVLSDDKIKSLQKSIRGDALTAYSASAGPLPVAPTIGGAVAAVSAGAIKRSSGKLKALGLDTENLSSEMRAQIMGVSAQEFNALVQAEFDSQTASFKTAMAAEVAKVKSAGSGGIAAVGNLNTLNEVQRTAASLAQQERETLGITGYRATNVVSSRSKGFAGTFGTGRGDIAAFRNEFGGDLSGLSGEASLIGASQIQASRSANRSRFGLVTSFAAPLLAAGIPQGAAGTSGGIAGGAASGALNGLGVGGSIGAFFPEILPFTLAAGAFIGGMVGALGKLHKSFEELVTEHVENNQKTEEELNAAQTIFQQLDSLKAANSIKDPTQRKEATDRITSDINDTFNNHLFDKKVRAIITNLLNNPSDENEETQNAALGNVAGSRIGKQNRSLTVFQSLQDFVKNVQRDEGHYEQSGRFNPLDDTSSNLKFVPGAVKGPTDKLASSLLSILPNVPQVANTLKAVIGGKDQKEQLGNILKSGGLSDAEIDSLGLTNELAKAFLEKVLELFQKQTPGGPAGKTVGLLTPTNDPKVKVLDDLGKGIVAQEQAAAEIKASAESNLKVNQNLQRILSSHSNTDLGRIQQSNKFDLSNLDTGFQSDTAYAIAAGKGKLYAATKGHESEQVNEQIKGINSTADIDALLALATGTPEQKAKLGGAATDEFIKTLRELKKSTDDLDSTYKKNRTTLQTINKQNVGEYFSKNSYDTAKYDSYATSVNSTLDYNTSVRQNDSQGVQQSKNLKKQIDALELRRRTGDISQIGYDIRSGFAYNQDESDTITRAGPTKLELARNRANTLSANPYTTGSQVASARYDQAYASGIGPQGSPLDSFKTGFSSVLEGFKKDANQFADIGKNLADSLSNNLGNAFGDFITGAKSAKDAFKSFAVSVLSDAARTLASKAVQQLLSAFVSLIGGSGGGGGGTGGGDTGIATTDGAQGGRFGFAKGGIVPSLLMGGEFVVGPKAAKKVGYTMLEKLNRFADGGYVHGGSGVRDDVPASLPVGSFVLRKSATQRLGPQYLNSLVSGSADGGSYSAPATRHFAQGGAVLSPMVSSAPSSGSGGSAPNVNIKIDINNNGSTSSSASASGGKDSGFGPDFADKLAKQVRGIVGEELVRQSRSDGIFAKGNPTNPNSGR